MKGFLNNPYYRTSLTPQSLLSPSNPRLRTKPFTGGSPKKDPLPKFQVTGSQWRSICREMRGDSGKALCVIKYFRQKLHGQKFNKSKSCLFRKELTDQQRIWFLPEKSSIPLSFLLFFFLDSSGKIILYEENMLFNAYNQHATHSTTKIPRRRTLMCGERWSLAANCNRKDPGINKFHRKTN